MTVIVWVLGYVGTSDIGLASRIEFWWEYKTLCREFFIVWQIAVKLSFVFDFFVSATYSRDVSGQLYQVSYQIGGLFHHKYFYGIDWTWICVVWRLYPVTSQDAYSGCSITVVENSNTVYCAFARLKFYCILVFE